MQMIKPVERGILDIPTLLIFSTIHPACRLRVQWDSLVLVILGTVCLLTPFVICFDIEYEQVSFVGVHLLAHITGSCCFAKYYSSGANPLIGRYLSLHAARLCMPALTTTVAQGYGRVLSTLHSCWTFF